MEGIKNYTEEIVETHLENILDQHPGVCRCDVCKRDMLAMALNQLPPHYASTEKGAIIVRSKLLSKQIEIDVIAALTQAIGRVSENVRHNQE